MGGGRNIRKPSIGTVVDTWTQVLVYGGASPNAWHTASLSPTLRPAVFEHKIGAKTLVDQ